MRQRLAAAGLMGWLVVGAVAAGGTAEAGAVEGAGKMAAEKTSERTWEERLDGARALVNVEEVAAGARGRRRVLVVYGCPNGNSAEWTLGGKAGPGVDWHYDIQHVLAQVRAVRERARGKAGGDAELALAVVEADGKSWPAWRGKRGVAGDVAIRAMVAHLRETVGADEVVLMGHSGGGSFLLGYVGGGEEIGAEVSRIVFLDANYSFDATKHGDKLMGWLRGGEQRRLVVIAYDDREIEINGKKVLSKPENGTYGASGRMVSWLKAGGVQVETQRRGPFEVTMGERGQVVIAVRENPEKVIWHTRLVGELNGVIYGLRVGAEPGVWLEGPRAYERWVGEPIGAGQGGATPRPVTTMPGASNRGARAVGELTIAERPVGAMGGRAVMEAVAGLAPAEREARIRQELLSGNVPAFLRRLKRVEVTGERGLTGEIWAMPDYVAVGSDEDWVRVPVTPATAVAVCQAWGGVIPTRKMVDDIWRAAEVRLEPKPLAPVGEKGSETLPTEQRIKGGRESVGAFLRANELVEQLRAGRELGLLVAGVKKDVVVSNRLAEKPGRVAIYGWHRTDGRPIQPLTTVHRADYVDYSHGLRVVGRWMRVGGELVELGDVMEDERCSLVSDEGVVTAAYPAER